MISNFSNILLLVSILPAIIWVIIIFQLIRKKIQNKTVFISIAGHMITISAFLIATSGLILTINKTQKEMTSTKYEKNKNQILNEQVYWVAEIFHLPAINDLDIIIKCKKSTDTIEPKNITISIEIVYLTLNNMLVDYPPSIVLSNLWLTKLSDREFILEINDIQDLLPKFRDIIGNVPSIDILSRPISINLSIGYNVELYAIAQANLFPEVVDENYNNIGLTEEISFQHTQTMRGN